MTDQLAEARAKIEAARDAIRSTPELAHLAERLDKAAAEVERVERRIAAKLDAAEPVLR